VSSPQEELRLALFVGDIGRALTQRPTLREKLVGCSEAMVGHLDAALARIWSYNEATGTLELQCSSGLYTHIDGSHARVPLGRWKIGLIASERLPHLTNDVVNDPRVHDQIWARAEGMVAFAGHPLLVEERLVGVAAMFARRPLGDLTLRALASAADSIALGIENVKLVEQMKRQAVQEERQRLARELHDSVSQALYGIALAAKSAGLDQVVELTGLAMAEMRALILELRPETLASEGLVGALKRLTLAARARSGLNVVESLGSEPPLDLEVKHALYRVVQEGLHNVEKHARAKRVEVRLVSGPREVALELRDDGVGFDATASYPGHLGLVSMRERTENVGGTWNLQSQTGVGTVISVRVTLGNV
jgi:signal transduction histidine kinase